LKTQQFTRLAALLFAAALVVAALQASQQTPPQSDKSGAPAPALQSPKPAAKKRRARPPETQAAPPPDTGPIWRIQFFYDKDNEQFRINDLQFASADRGIAVGAVVDSKGHIKPMSVLTSDGGLHWQMRPLDQAGLSVFFLNESVGWMITDDGIWKTEESGRTWRRQKREKGLQRVYFTDELHGWAVGWPKKIVATTDGGKHWEDVPAAGKPEADPNDTSYDIIAFENPKLGVIIGGETPAIYQRLPAWVDPADAARRREAASRTVTLATPDGGKTWIPSTVSTYGRTSEFRLLGDAALVLVRFEDADAPSEVFLNRPHNPKRIFMQRNRMVTDCAWVAPDDILLAAIEPPGRVYQMGIPGKLHIIRGAPDGPWREMRVDYKAFGSEAMLSVVDAGHAWVATDTGMILRLMPE
jgi:photosystem II stability/assembly factor-like uncharacterized protein